MITVKTIQQACESTVLIIEEEREEQINKNRTDVLSCEAQLYRAIENAGFSSNAFMPWDKLDFSLGKKEQLPDGISMGSLKHPLTGEPFFPAILPFTSSNATAFCIDSSSDTIITDLMQMLAMRALLSVPVELVSCHFVDLYSSGRFIKQINKLHTSATERTVISDKRKLSDFITYLEGVISGLYKKELRDYSTLRSYNADSSHRGAPYHFVFFPHIHDRIDRDIISRIYSLCSDMNAASCGIYFFYSIDRDAIAQQGPLQDLLNISTVMLKSDENYRLSHSIYGQDWEERYTIEINKELPTNLEKIVNEINDRTEHAGKIDFDEDMGTLIESERYWKESTVDGITIPIGNDESNNLVHFSLGGNGESTPYFAMIGGRPGYGKTVLLHDIICYGSILYSPQELEFYLMDCTNGTGFKPYENLPHARFVSITKQREYTDSAIEYLVNEMYHRAELFTNAAEDTGEVIEKIEAYRLKTGKLLPRILIIIDEFQVLLEKRDRLSIKIASSLGKIIREGRKYGISILFCTQSYRQLGVEFNTDLITLRIAFNLKDTDSYKVLGTGNDAAAHLRNKGDAIINYNAGEKEDNIFFHAYYQKMMHHYVDFCARKWDEFDGLKPKRFVFDNEAVSNLGDNEQYIKSLNKKINPHHITTFVGVPLFIREKHSYITFRNSNDSNLLICGKDIRAALSTIALVNYQLKQALIYSPHALFIADYFNESSDETHYLSDFASSSDILYIQKKETLTTLEQLEEKLEERIKDNHSGINKGNAPIIGTIAFLQNAPEMEKEGYHISKMATIIQNILKKGPAYGIHLIIYIDNYKRVSDSFDSSIMSRFGNRIILSDGALDSRQAEEVKLLEDGHALLYTEDKTTTYERDPVMLYNKFCCDTLKDKVLNDIFSIYPEKKT